MDAWNSEAAREGEAGEVRAEIEAELDARRRTTAADEQHGADGEEDAGGDAEGDHGAFLTTSREEERAHGVPVVVGAGSSGELGVETVGPVEGPAMAEDRGDHDAEREQAEREDDRPGELLAAAPGRRTRGL